MFVSFVLLCGMGAELDLERGVLGNPLTQLREHRIFHVLVRTTRDNSPQKGVACSDGSFGCLGVSTRTGIIVLKVA